MRETTQKLNCNCFFTNPKLSTW